MALPLHQLLQGVLLVRMRPIDRALLLLDELCPFRLADVLVLANFARVVEGPHDEVEILGERAALESGEQRILLVLTSGIRI